MSSSNTTSSNNDNKRRSKEGDPDRGLLSNLRTYPRSVFFMLGNEFCERFSFYGMRSILTLYFIMEHHFQDSTASLLYHGFISLAYFSSLFGSIAADNFFGRFRVILWVSLVYVAGHFLLSVGALPQMDISMRSFFDFFGLFVIAMATGGIKPCVSAFAADQFDASQQQQRSQFFSFFYFAINAGSVFAMFLTPILRGRVHCLGSEHCFPLAFGVPGVLMFTAFIIFILGIPTYKRVPVAKGNIIWRVVKCIFYALGQKLLALIRFKRNKPEHWLDYAVPKYDEQLVASVKNVCAIFVMLIPAVLFWALFDQQGSTWVLQARQMDGRVGPITIFPDQMMTLNPLIVLIMVPIFEGIIYPAVNKVWKLTPLRKMGVGGMLTALSFVLAGFVQLMVNTSLAPGPAEGNVFVVRMGNSSDRFFFLSDTAPDGRIELRPNARIEWPLKAMSPSANETHSPSVLNETDTQGRVSSGVILTDADERRFSVNLFGEQGEPKDENVKTKHPKDNAPPCGYVLALFDVPESVATNGSLKSFGTFPFSCKKPESSRMRLMLVTDKRSRLVGTEFFVLDSGRSVVSRSMVQPIVSVVEIQPGFYSSPDYTLAYGGGCAGELFTTETREPTRPPLSLTNETISRTDHGMFCRRLRIKANAGAVVAITLDERFDEPAEEERLPTAAERVELVAPNTVNIAWQFPQFFIITLGEVLFSVSGLEFSYSQAPTSMKSVMQASWLMTTFFGDIIDMGISGMHLVKDPATEFFVYALLAFLVICLFIALATRYTYVEDSPNQQQAIIGDEDQSLDRSRSDA